MHLVVIDSHIRSPEWRVVMRFVTTVVLCKSFVCLRHLFKVLMGVTWDLNQSSTAGEFEGLWFPRSNGGWYPSTHWKEV